MEADPDSTGGRTVAACVNCPELLTPFSEMGAATSGSLVGLGYYCLGSICAHPRPEIRYAMSCSAVWIGICANTQA